MRRKRSLAVLAFTMIALASGNSLLGQERCYKDYEEAVSKLEAKMGPELKATAAEIKKIQDAGFDPARYIVDFEGKLVPITYKFYILSERLRDQAQAELKTTEKCAEAVMPIRAAADLAIIYQTMGLSLLLPDEMTRIDFEEIRRGKPLGSDQALIPKVRDDALKTLGIGGDVGKVIKDPKCIFGGCG